MRPERDNRRGGTLLAVLLACGLLTALHGRAERRGYADPVSGTVRDLALVPGQTGLAMLGQSWHLSVGSLLSGPRLARENEDLKARILDLTAQNKELLSEKGENVRLRGLLGFQQRSPRPLLAAQVVALKPDPHADTLTLDRGSAQGVHEHSVIVAPNGALVGQVLDVSPRSCTVLLLTDGESSVGALVHNHTLQGPIGLCQGDGQERLRVTYLRSDTLLHVGDAVTTSGLGGVFPKAVPIGAVQTISVDKTRSLQTALLRPSADFDHLQEVFVLQEDAPAPAPVPVALPPAASPAPVQDVSPPASPSDVSPQGRLTPDDAQSDTSSPDVAPVDPTAPDASAPDTASPDAVPMHRPVRRRRR